MREISTEGSLVNIVRDDTIYVDKTELIYDLVKKTNRFFISRPRRFGKSLTLDTIGTLFEFGVEQYFKNTWIYDKWTESTCPVLRLNFLKYNVNDPNEFKKDLNFALSAFASKYKVKDFKEQDEPTRTMLCLLEALNKEGRSVVILIDEYDCQMSANISNPELYDKFKQLIRSFYDIIKDMPAVRLMMVTLNFMIVKTQILRSDHLQ